jgi:Tat protein secretion system quality control protein TatD with DNase activity
MMQLIEKASPTCVAVGECGMDTSNKNNIEMADQVEVTKQATGAQGYGEVG